MNTKLLLLASACALQCVAQEKIIVVNEGMWQSDSGRLSYFEDGQMVSNQWFRDVNDRKLGDTPNDIIQINDNLIAIAMNWSNIIQFINPRGEAVGETEDVPNNRKLASDGNYVYATSYAHEVGYNGSFLNFEKGYVAKIDVNTFEVVAATEVGYEPEGIALYDGHLFVANTGGYAFQEGHDYESTVSVVDASNMEVVRTIDVEQINLYSKMSKSGQYLCINSPGDYYEVDPATIIFDCRAALDNKPDEECFVKLNSAATYNCTAADGRFYAIGSFYSYNTGVYEFNYNVIDPEELFATEGTSGVYDSFPGTVMEDILSLSMPYGIYVNPYTGYIYATDAGEYTGAGALYQWTPEGEFVDKYKTYINPGHFLALPPDGKFESVADVVAGENATENGIVYNLQGIPVRNKIPGQLYICNGKKFIYCR